MELATFVEDVVCDVGIVVVLDFHAEASTVWKRRILYDRGSSGLGSTALEVEGGSFSIVLSSKSELHSTNDYVSSSRFEVIPNLSIDDCVAPSIIGSWDELDISGDVADWSTGIKLAYRVADSDIWTSIMGVVEGRREANSIVDDISNRHSLILVALGEAGRNYNFISDGPSCSILYD